MQISNCRAMQGRPALVLGDTVYIIAADTPKVQYAAAVVATDSTRVLLAMPQAFWLRACKGLQECPICFVGHACCADLQLTLLWEPITILHDHHRQRGKNYSI